MIINGAPNIDRYWNAVADAVPMLTVEEQHAAVMLYRELAKGEPVGVEQLAAALNIPAVKTEELLQRPSIRTLTYPAT